MTYSEYINKLCEGLRIKWKNAKRGALNSAVIIELTRVESYIVIQDDDEKTYSIWVEQIAQIHVDGKWRKKPTPPWKR